MWNDLIDAEPTGQLLAAWIAKEELRALLATARRGGQRHDITHRLHCFYDWCARIDIPEVTTLATTIDAWWPEVLGFLETGITNAGTEGRNRLVKEALPRRALNVERRELGSSRARHSRRRRSRSRSRA
jgi:transposase